MKRILWIVQTTDELQLPLGVFDSAKELAKAAGVCETTIYKAINSSKASGRRCKFEKVVVDVNPGEIKNYGAVYRRSWNG